MTNAPLLQVQNLTVTLRGQELIRDISFGLDRHDFLAIIGPNGAGKTVLVKALLGLLPSRGEVRWQGGRRVGYVPQQVYLDRSISVTLFDFLQLKASLLALPKEAIDRALADVGLPNTTRSMPLAQLSGGQLQRALIALALLGDPNVLFLDEPTASVDGPGEEQIYSLLHRLQDERGTAIVLVSHELDLVRNYATHILCINRELVCFGEPELYLQPETLHKLYGGGNHVNHVNQRS